MDQEVIFFFSLSFLLLSKSSFIPYSFYYHLSKRFLHTFAFFRVFTHFFFLSMGYKVFYFLCPPLQAILIPSLYFQIYHMVLLFFPPLKFPPLSCFLIFLMCQENLFFSAFPLPFFLCFLYLSFILFPLTSVMSFVSLLFLST